MTNPKHFTDADLLKAIEDSGYPFELKVAADLMSLGYDVKPTHRFFSKARDKDLELDILAFKRQAVPTPSGTLDLTLQLAVECKDNSLPYVLFGLPISQRPLPGALDPDSLYCQIQTTDDTNTPSQLTLFAFDASQPTNPKASHHQFNTAERFHLAAAAEPNGDRLKLNVSERLKTGLSTLGEYLETAQAAWVDGIQFVRAELFYNRSLTVTFPLLVHSGGHKRLVAPAVTPTDATHTSLFTTLQGPRRSYSYVVDFISYSALRAALTQIEASHQALARHMVRYIKPSKRPPKA